MNTTHDFDLTPFQEPALHADAIARLLAHDLPHEQARAFRLHDYYANPQIGENQSPPSAASAPVRPSYAQEQGLPERIVGSAAHSRKEVVLENDIGWRIDAGVDLLFGSAPTLQSLCPDPTKADLIERLLAGVFEASGGLTFFAKLALAGSTYGSTDVLLRPGPAPAPFPSSARSARGTPDAPGVPVPPTSPRLHDESASPRDTVNHAPSVSLLLAYARSFLLEVVPAGNGLPLFDPADSRRLLAFVQHVVGHPSRAEGLGETCTASSPSAHAYTEIFGHTWWQRYQDGELLAQGPNPLGRIPLVHIQNLSRPFAWQGTSDVEPLIPLQDELNTRLSDRAHRVTMTSFRMYLGKRIPDFVERKIGPGQMWATDDEKASIESFGGDADCPSERDHVREIREALDKTSGINPLAAGVLRDKLGNLTSGVALRVTLLGAVARTNRKRLVYGRGIQEMAELVLAWFDFTGLLPTAPDERRIELHWPPVLPDDLERDLELARLRLAVGVPQETVLRELGYDESVFQDPTS